MTDRYLVTGGMGCIGAWALHHLVQQGKQAVNFDISDDHHRLDWLMSEEEQSKITFVKGDLTNTEQVKAVMSDYDITHIVHLGALQVPMCRANPSLGAQVNVTGTINIFEAARSADIGHVVYASSIAVYGPADEYPTGLITHNAQTAPRTLYGAYKVCNEQTSQVYYNDYGITSTALRPYTVYGVGRDQGLTSEPTKAMAAASRDDDYQISFGGKMQFHFASDTALQFLAAVDNPLDGAYVFNLGTPAVAVQDVANIIMDIKPDVTITVDENPLPFPEACDPSALHQYFDTVYETSLTEAISETIKHMERLGL